MWRSRGIAKINCQPSSLLSASPHKFCETKFAFTLAETLITLVIVGVIAAITVPSLISKYREEQFKTQFKKAYSTITQAMNTTNLLDFNGNVSCYYNLGYSYSTQTSDCKQFYDLFTDKMVITKKCMDNALRDSCVPKYSSYAASGSGCGGYSETNVNTRNPAYVLSSGQIIMNYNATGIPVFVVDINGFKGPNKGGYDVFPFIIRKMSGNSGLKIEHDSCFPTEPGGKTTYQMMKYAFGGME